MIGGNPIGRWFDNRKVRSKILIAVAAVATAGIVSAVIGISNLTTVYDAGNEVVTTNLVPAADLADAQIAVGQVQEASRDVFLLRGAAQDAAEKSLKELDDLVDAKIAAYLPSAADPAKIGEFKV